MPPLVNPAVEPTPPGLLGRALGVAGTALGTGVGLAQVAVALPGLVVRAERALTRLEPTVQQLEAATTDGSLATALAAAGRADGAVTAIEGLPGELARLRTELREDLARVADPLSSLHGAAVPLLERLAPMLDDLLGLRARLDALLVEGELDTLVAQARRVPGLLADADRLVTWACEVTDGADASVVPELLRRVDAELLPILVGLDGTQADGVGLREAVERLVAVMDTVGGQLATLPGAGLLRRRASKEENGTTVPER